MSFPELEQVLSLYDEYEREKSPWPSKQEQQNIFEQLRNSGGCVLVAVLESSVVGTCTLNVCPNFSWSGRPYAIIENVIVTRTQHNKGIGKALLSHAANLAESKGCYKVALMTGSKELSTLKFYESAGFIGNKQGFQRRFNA
ncbi:MAG: GNAT family N-acetyltransferase [Polaromonas sp.]|nr:GNAT family N-acetyltransferase [Polaromonas sp.]